MRCIRVHGLSMLTSMYCGAIIVGLFISSCYWYTVVPSVSIDIDRWSLGSRYIANILEWLGRTPSSTVAPVEVNNSSCTTCWVDLLLSKSRSMLDATPRPLTDGMPMHSAPCTLFLGIPGTQLGMTLDFGI